MPTPLDATLNEIVEEPIEPPRIKSYGTLAHVMKDHLYLVGQGYLYTSPWVTTESTARYCASILLTTKGDRFVLSTATQTGRYNAVAIKPLAPRGLRAENVRLISLGISPTHESFRRFRAIPRPGFLPIPHDTYDAITAEMDAAYQGELSVAAARRLFDDIVHVTMRYLPGAKRADPRIERALRMLQENPHYPLADLARTIGLSYDRMSHLFAESVGLPLRSYLLWLKVNIVSLQLGSGKTLTEIAQAAGFTDSAHFSNTWQQAFGVSPSYFLDNNDVRIRAACIPSAT